MNTNEQTIHQMGLGISNLVKQATGRESVSSIDMDWVSVEQLARYIYGSGSGDVVSFDTNIPDAIESLIAYIAAVQDLNGYDNPWPAGGGKNLLQNTGTSQTISDVIFTVNSDGSVVCNGTASAGIEFFVHVDIQTLTAGTSYIINGCPSGGGGSTYKLDIHCSGGYYTDTGSGATFTFNPLDSGTEDVRIVIYSGTVCNNLTFYPMIRLATVTDDSFAPYSNICPITGWTGCNVSHTGINQWDEQWESGLISSLTGQNENNAAWIRSKNYINVKGSTKYYYKHPANSFSIRYYDINKNYIGYVAATTASAENETPANCAYVRFCIMRTTYNNDISMNYPSSDTEYHSYTGHLYAFTFPDEAGTVYGGKLDVLSGVLTVTHGIADLGILPNNRTWSYISNIDAFRCDNIGAKGVATNVIADIICSVLKARSYNYVQTTTIDDCIAVRTNGGLLVHYNGYTDAQLFTTAVTGQKLVYELATPLTYQLTAREVEALVGENNIFADTGNVSVQYKVKEDLV